MDTNKSGKIDYSEFVNMIIEKKKILTIGNLRIAFDSLDYDHNGSLTIEEL